MNEIENTLRQNLIGKKLTGVELYDINKGYFYQEEVNTIVFRGGIELVFEEACFSLYWDINRDLYDTSDKKIDELFDELEYEDLGVSELDDYKKIIDQTIKDIVFKWNFYHEYDDNQELKEEKNFIPYELLITFADDSVLQISTVQFSVREQKLDRIMYDSQHSLLVSVDHLHEIEMPED